MKICWSESSVEDLKGIKEYISIEEMGDQITKKIYPTARIVTGNY
jgi:hypothetical protein